MKLPFNTQAVVGLSPKADAFDGTVNSQCISMKDYHTVQGFVARGVSSAVGVNAQAKFGTGNSEIVIQWNNTGAAGNGKSVTFINPGPNGEFSVDVSSTHFTMTYETDESGVIRASVNETISSISDTPGFLDFWTATSGSGTGEEVPDGFGTLLTSGGVDGIPGTCLITVEKCLNAAGSSAEAIEFFYRKVSSAGVTGPLIRATTAGFTTDAEAFVNYEIIINDKIQGIARGDKPFVRIKSVEIQNIPVYGAVLLVGSGSRYGIAGSVT